MLAIDEDGKEFELSADTEVHLVIASSAMHIERLMRLRRKMSKTFLKRDISPYTPPTPPERIHLTLRELVWWVMNKNPQGRDALNKYTGAVWLLNRYDLSSTQENRVVQRLLGVLKAREDVPNPFLPDLAGLTCLLSLLVGVSRLLPGLALLTLWNQARHSKNWGRKDLWDASFPLLLRIGGVETVPLLCSHIPKRFRQEAHFKLLRLLPQLSAEHFGAFEKTVGANLCSLLTQGIPKEKGDFQRIMILTEALEKVGEESVRSSGGVRYPVTRKTGGMGGTD